MSRALVLTGGRGHPAEASIPSLRATVPEFDLDVDEDVERGLRRLGDNHDLLVVNALQFEMTHARYDDVRADHAFTLSTAGERTIEQWHAGGRPILALHTGIISFDSWTGWSAILGGRWNWSTSSHPPIGPCRVTAGEHVAELDDEAYQHLDIHDGITIVASTTANGRTQPAAWTRRPAGAGRVAVDVLGHDARSLDHPFHVALLRGLIRYLLGADHVTLDEEVHP